MELSSNLNNGAQGAAADNGNAMQDDSKSALDISYELQQIRVASLCNDMSRVDQTAEALMVKLQGRSAAETKIVLNALIGAFKQREDSITSYRHECEHLIQLMMKNHEVGEPCDHPQCSAEAKLQYSKMAEQYKKQQETLANSKRAYDDLLQHCNLQITNLQTTNKEQELKIAELEKQLKYANDHVRILEKHYAKADTANKAFEKMQNQIVGEVQAKRQLEERLNGVIEMRDELDEAFNEYRQQHANCGPPVPPIVRALGITKTSKDGDYLALNIELQERITTGAVCWYAKRRGIDRHFGGEERLSITYYVEDKKKPGNFVSYSAQADVCRGESVICAMQRLPRSTDELNQLHAYLQSEYPHSTYQSAAVPTRV